MKKTIYYFSATGNSLQTAIDIAESIGNADVVSIAKSGMETNCDSDVIGFVFPVFMVGLPNMVKDFINSGHWRKDAYIFAVATCGMSAGCSFTVIDELLRKKGAQLSYGATLCMGTNYIVKYEVKPEARKKFLRKADNLLQKIISDVKTQKLNKWPRGFFLSRKIHDKKAAAFNNADKNYVVTNSCNGCEKCSRVCPANNIEIIKSKPVFQHKCEHCLACIHWCPQKAINVLDKTQNKMRYHHPKVKVEQLP